MSRECKRGADSSAPLVSTPSPPRGGWKYERVCGRRWGRLNVLFSTRRNSPWPDVVTSPGPLTHRRRVGVFYEEQRKRLVVREEE